MLFWAIIHRNYVAATTNYLTFFDRWSFNRTIRALALAAAPHKQIFQVENDTHAMTNQPELGSLTHKIIDSYHLY